MQKGWAGWGSLKPHWVVGGGSFRPHPTLPVYLGQFFFCFLSVPKEHFLAGGAGLRDPLSNTALAKRLQ